jgi:HSP20 family molecular chaperone IbpA
MRDDDFFGNDMNDIMREFFGQVNGRRTRQKEDIEEVDEEGNKVEVIDLEEEMYLIFDLPGYDEKDLDIGLKDKTLIVSVKKKGECKIQDYLSKKLCKGETMKKIIPPYVEKEFKQSFKSGVLEIKFNKK